MIQQLIVDKGRLMYLELQKLTSRISFHIHILGLTWTTRVRGSVEKPPLVNIKVKVAPEQDLYDTSTEITSIHHTRC